jgi:hypothetical protein
VSAYTATGPSLGLDTSNSLDVYVTGYVNRLRSAEENGSMGGRGR